VIFLLDKLDLKKIYCRGYSINKRKEIVIKKLKTLFLKAWFHEKDNVSGKLKYIGNLPISERTAIFELLLFTPKVNLQNFKFILSVTLF
jgi:hypothetical protein